MKQLSVSVVIPNYNYGRFLNEAIESVFAQSYPCSELILVDDGSTDNSLEIAERFGSKIKIIRQKNQGVGMARNTGAKKSTGDIIAFLDADDYWAVDKIQKQVSCFEKDAEVGLVTCGMHEFGMNGHAEQQFLKSDEGWIADKIVTFDGNLIASGSAIAIRRDIFEKTAGFDERKDLHPSEDWEFCYRVATISKIGFVPEALVHYRNHGNNGHLKIPKMENAMLLAFEKIYRDAPPAIQQKKRKSYGNLNAVLAGSYFHAGNYSAFARTAIKSIWYRPQHITTFLGYPFRLLKRKSK